MSVLVNPARDPAAVPPPRDVALAFHRSLEAYAATPVRPLEDGTLVKDETSRLGLPAFKALGASWAVECALSRAGAGAGDGVRRLVAASAGNHGRAVARMAALRGLACAVFVPARSLDVRRAAIAGEGAEVVVVDGTYEDAVLEAEAAAREPGTVLISDVGDAPSAHDVIDGYATLFAELPPVDVVLVPVGVGSLAAAAARFGSVTATAVVGVEPVTAACLTASLAAGEPVVVDTPGTAMAGMDCAEVSPAAWPSLRPGIAGTVLVADDELPRAMDELEATGVEGGECSAAAVAAWHRLADTDEAAPLRSAIGLRPGARVVILATEGRTSQRR